MAALRKGARAFPDRAEGLSGRGVASGASVVAGNFLERGLGVREAAQAGLLEADPLQRTQPPPVAGGAQVIQEQANGVDGQRDHTAYPKAERDNATFRPL
jgi:hypothetical protein